MSESSFWHTEIQQVWDEKEIIFGYVLILSLRESTSTYNYVPHEMYCSTFVNHIFFDLTSASFSKESLHFYGRLAACSSPSNQTDLTNLQFRYTNFAKFARDATDTM
jgi:hypothetical protein